MGGSQFCFKVCDPAGADAANYCQHIYDRIGCFYNAPNNAQNGTFESCLGDSQAFPGIYTDSAGAVQTYTQPPESLGAISTMPYQPSVPPSSSCTTFSSAELFASLSAGTAAASATITGSAGASGTKSGASASATGKAGASKSGTATGSASGASSTSNDATVVAMSGVIGLFGVAFSALFLA